jgi:hypothetical protein
MQKAAAEKFGLPIQDYMEQAFQRGLADAYGETIPAGAAAKEVADARKIVDAMYDLTQEWFEEQGITSMRLVRGMEWTTSRGLSTPDEILGLYAKEDGTDILDFEFNPLTSFSTRPESAEAFSGTQAQHGVMAFLDVDVRDIVGMPITGLGCTDEYEFVIVGGVRQTFFMTNPAYGQATMHVTDWYHIPNSIQNWWKVYDPDAPFFNKYVIDFGDIRVADDVALRSDVFYDLRGYWTYTDLLQQSPEGLMQEAHNYGEEIVDLMTAYLKITGKT